MSIWESLLSGGIKGVAEGIGTLAVSIRTALTGEAPMTAEQRAAMLEQLAAVEAAAQAAAANYDTAQMQGQIDINKVEAASEGLFKSGWRPALGWVGACGYAYMFLLRPLLPWIVQVGGLIFGKHAAVPEMPALDWGPLAELTLGLLGLGAMRSYDKRQRLLTQGSAPVK